MKRKLALLAILLAGVPMVVAAPISSAAPSHISNPCSTTSAGYVQATLSWGVECLHAGEFCKVGNVEYHAYGFDCPASGRLTYWSSTPPPTTTAAPTATTAPAVTATTPPSTTTATPPIGKAPHKAACGAGYVNANLPWGHKCLRAGEFCKIGNAAYRRYGFICPASGHLRRR